MWSAGVKCVDAVAQMLSFPRKDNMYSKSETFFIPSMKRCTSHQGREKNIWRVMLRLIGVHVIKMLIISFSVFNQTCIENLTVSVLGFQTAK